MSTSSNLKKKLEKIYYSPKGYWRGYSAIKRLSTVAGVSEEEAKSWLKKQAMWQIYLPAPKYIPRPNFDITIPNEVHQADLLFLPHDRLPRGRKTYKYALTVVDVASRYKEAEPLASKESAEVAKAFSTIYKRVLRWPKLLQVDPGREFMGEVNKLMKSKNVQIRRGEKALHRSQAIVERFNRTLAEKLFGHQYAQEILLEARLSTQGPTVANVATVKAGTKSNGRSREWVARLPRVIAALNKEPTRLIGLKAPLEANKLLKVEQISSSKSHPEKLLPRGIKVRYLYQPGELEGGERRRATDPIWSLDLYEIRQVMGKDPIVYYLHNSVNSPLKGAPKRGFVREELLVVPLDTQLPPSTLK